MYLQRKYRIYNIFGRFSNVVHATLISIFWGIFVLTLIFSAGTSARIWQGNRSLGVGIWIVAIGIFNMSIRQIGLGALFNDVFFGKKPRKLKGIYKYLQDPIYCSYLLGFIGAFMYGGKLIYLILGIISYLGLNLIESKTEKLR